MHEKAEELSMNILKHFLERETHSTMFHLDMYSSLSMQKHLKVQIMQYQVPIQALYWSNIDTLGMYKHLGIIVQHT